MSIHDSDYIVDDHEFYSPDGPIVDGERMGKGLVERDYVANPIEMGRAFDPEKIPLIPPEEWPERLEEMTAKKMRISDIIRRSGPGGGPIPSQNQGNSNYCWIHSGVAGLMASRAASNMPYVRLSPFSAGTKIKRYSNSGGWGCEGVDFLTEHGCCTVDDWPERSWSRSHDTAENWERAKEFRVDETWMELRPAAWDRDMTFHQVVTCYLSGIPVITDYNHWRHSVLGCDLVDLKNGRPVTDWNRWGNRIWNSWSDNWGTQGYGILKGKKAIPDGGCAIRSTHGG